MHKQHLIAVGTAMLIGAEVGNDVGLASNVKVGNHVGYASHTISKAEWSCNIQKVRDAYPTRLD